MLTTSRVARDLLTKTNDRLLSTTNAQRRQYPCCYCIHIGSDYRQAYNPHIMPPSEHNTRYCGGKTTAATNELLLVLYVPLGCAWYAHTQRPALHLLAVGHINAVLFSPAITNAWFPALRFRSSVQIRSSSIFPFPFGQCNGNGATERLCGQDYVNGLRKRIWMNGNVMLETKHNTVIYTYRRRFRVDL